MELLEGIRSQRAVDRRWKGKGDCGELADGVSAFYILFIIAGSRIFFLLAKLLIFEQEDK